MDEWEQVRRPNADQMLLNIADRCYLILHEVSKQTGGEWIGERLKESGFTSEYLDKQRQLMREYVTTHPTATIDIAKELVEFCCKTTLEENNAQYSKDNDLPKLVDKTQTTLEMNPRRVSKNVPDEKAVKALLGSLTSVARHLGELRNSYGIGHRKGRVVCRVVRTTCKPCSRSVANLR